MTKEELEKYKKDFKETDAYKWFSNLSDEDKRKFKFAYIDSCVVIQGELAISFKGIKKLYELYGEF